MPSRATTFSSSNASILPTHYSSESHKFSPSIARYSLRDSSGKNQYFYSRYKQLWGCGIQQIAQRCVHWLVRTIQEETAVCLFHAVFHTRNLLSAKILQASDVTHPARAIFHRSKHNFHPKINQFLDKTSSDSERKHENYPDGRIACQTHTITCGRNDLS